MNPRDLVVYFSSGPIRRIERFGGKRLPRVLLQEMQPGGAVPLPSPPTWIAFRGDHLRLARPDEIAAGYAIPEQRPGYPIGGPHAS